METSEGSQDAVVIGVPRETVSGERRVALIPETVQRLDGSGAKIIIESCAGESSFFSDEAYRTVGAEVVSREQLFDRSQIVAKVQPPTPDEVAKLKPGTILISFLDRGRDGEAIASLGQRDVVAFSFNAVPRITRAQSMDAMSSMSTIGGYKAVLMAANAVGRFFPLLMTAAGTVPPARVFVIGAGVAGLQALATAKRLGAVTEGFDTRPAVREQVQSVGAAFVEMPLQLEGTEGEGGYAREMEEEFLLRERKAIHDPVVRSDVIITTAMIPGKRAPVLIEEEAIKAMRPGSVIVDLAAEAGGNTELTVPGETITVHGVTILAPFNLPSSLPVHASQMYSRNVAAVIGLLLKDGQINLDPEDEIIRGACLTGLEVKA